MINSHKDLDTDSAAVILKREEGGLFIATVWNLSAELDDEIVSDILNTMFGLAHLVETDLESIQTAGFFLRASEAPDTLTPEEKKLLDHFDSSSDNNDPQTRH